MIHFPCLRPSGGFVRQALRRLSFRRPLATLLLWHGRHRQRCDLAELEDHHLLDLGLTREDVRRECAKSFWRL